MSKTLQELAQEAIDVQNACNLLAVVNGMSRALSDLRGFVSGSDELRNHPITLLWADKVSHLTGTQDIGNSVVMKAYAAAHDLAEGKAA